MTEPDTIPGARIAAALAKFQSDLPKVTKGQEADVKSKEGKKLYSYKYADLAELSAVVLPALAAQGIAWTCPTVMTDRGLILRGQLIHESGELLDAVWPLPNTADSKALGGAVTYGRRYLLSTLTGVAAEEDNDAAHTEVLREYDDRPHGGQQRRREAEPERPARDPAVAELGGQIEALIKARGWDAEAVRERFAQEYGVPAAMGNAEQLGTFLGLLREDAAVEDAADEASAEQLAEAKASAGYQDGDVR
jgi:hypothetical protein